MSARKATSNAVLDALAGSAALEEVELTPGQQHERLARWLLMIRDRLGSPRVKLTHEFASRMLGVRRVGVTMAASKLQREGLIRDSRGDVEILDEAGLVAASCACFDGPAAIGTQPVEPKRAAATAATL